MFVGNLAKNAVYTSCVVVRAVGPVTLTAYFLGLLPYMRLSGSESVHPHILVISVHLSRLGAAPMSHARSTETIWRALLRAAAKGLG